MYVDTHLSEDAARLANRSGPLGCYAAAVTRQRVAWLHRQSSAAHRTTTCQPPHNNAGYAEILSRL